MDRCLKAQYWIGRLAGLALLLTLGGCANYQALQGEVDYGASYITAQRNTPGRLPAADLTPQQAKLQAELQAVFQRYQGTPYHYGGTSARGFDCSGFIMTAYREALGQGLPRTTGQMLASGQRVRREQLQPGDVVFFRIRGKEQHAGIYMGDERFIHASTSKGVIKSSLNSNYWRTRYSQGRRFVQPAPQLITSESAPYASAHKRTY